MSVWICAVVRQLAPVQPSGILAMACMLVPFVHMVLLATMRRSKLFVSFATANVLPLHSMPVVVGVVSNPCKSVVPAKLSCPLAAL